MIEVFVDTSWFKAIADDKDEFHLRGKKVEAALEVEKALLVTTNYILDEAFTLIRVRRSLERAMEFRQTLFEMSGILKIVRVTSVDEVEAWGWFVKNWSKLSFTDCTCFAVMKRLGIKRVATFDKHFKRAGFEVIGV